MWLFFVSWVKNMKFSWLMLFPGDWVERCFITKCFWWRAVSRCIELLFTHLIYLWGNPFFLQRLRHLQFFIFPNNRCCFFPRESPVFSSKAHVFQIDPATKKSWIPCSKQAVTVSFYYDKTKETHRIISVDGNKVNMIKRSQN